MNFTSIDSDLRRATAGLSPEEERQLNELLIKREQSQGLVLPKAKASVSKAGGSMSDASKRQRVVRRMSFRMPHLNIWRALHLPLRVR